MKRGLSWMSGAVVIALVCGTTDLAEAQNGPYYAPPSWDQTLACATTTNCPRFIAVMGGAAVLDRETGLVWEKSPSDFPIDWDTAQRFCNQRTLGNRKGWRLPTIQDLASLIDPSVPFPGPTLPAGHPFVGVQTLFYWSATRDSGSPDFAWRTSFGTGVISTALTSQATLFWCVRGGHGTDAQ